MADPDPNPNVNLAGSGVALHVQRPDGEFVPVQGTTAGELPVTATGTGGESLATETTVDRTADATEALAETIAPGGVPVPGQPALAIINIDPPPAFAAAPTEGTELEAVYIAGTAPFLLDRDSVARPVFVEPSAAEIATNVGTISGQLPEELGPNGGLKVEVLASELPVGAATEMAQASLEVEVEAVRDRLPPALDDGRLAARLDVGTEDAPLVASTPAYGRTSFGQIRVAQRSVTFENVQAYGLDLRAWAPRTAGAGSVTFDAASGMTLIAVTSASGDVGEISTHTHFPYEPGSTSHAIMTLAHSDAGQSGQTREWGFGTLDDGFFFRLVGVDLYVVRRSSSSGTPTDGDAIPRASWNGDHLDGTGPSGRVLDLAKINQFEIDYQWLSAGVVRFWIGGVLVHSLDLRGAVVLPATRTGQLPLRITATNTGASAAATLSYVCSVVYLDGGTTLRFVPGSHSLSTPKTGITTTFTPVVAFRMAATYLGRANRKIVLPALARISNASGRGTVRLMFNPTTITGGSWSAITNAPWVEYNEGVTSITGGTVTTETYLPNTADVRTFSGSEAFALNGTHMRRTADNASGDSLVFMAKADAGNIDIVSLLAAFNTLG